MPDYFSEHEIYESTFTKTRKKGDNYLLHIGLFLLTFVTTTIAGAEWVSGTMGPYEFSYLAHGLPYSISIIFIISFHEFGHYFAAKFHRVNATLPFYIPFPPFPGFLNFGTMGAVIKTKSPINTNKAMFDIGVAGPIAGFIATLIVLLYGFTHVPGKEYILAIHPDYFSASYGTTGLQLQFGNTLLFSFFKSIFADNYHFFPPMTEIYHYPYLCVGWFGMLITAMNMIPVGQLDGGHIGYTMFGHHNHYKIAVVSFAVLFVLGILGVIETFMEINLGIGWTGWLFWALILYFLIKLKHPPVPDETELNGVRKILGYLSYFILIISFSPSPFIIKFAG